MSSWRTPDWVKDAVFYQIFPDRFAQSETLPKPSNLEPWNTSPSVLGFKGGDLLGVVERLDYLQDLGVSALYFNPVFQSASNHRYHTYDYFEVDPLLGGNQALRRLLDEAHRRDMRVILDGVFNHASRGFYQFHHALENEHASPYLDWFLIKGFPLNAYEHEREPNYAAWWNLHALPKFNVQTPAVREFLLKVAGYWIEFGVDGWRLDVPEEIRDATFWQVFRERVKSVRPDAYLVGEIWHPAPEWLGGDRFDAVMNYVLTKACLGFFIEGSVQEDLVRDMAYAPVPHLDVGQFAAAIDHALGLYDWEITQAQLNLLDSHDTARFLTLARGDTTALRLAVLFQMTFPGAPCVYYGDEVGMLGGRDPDCRRSFDWDASTWNRELREHYRRAIALRNDHPALRRGEFRKVHAYDGIYAFIRALDGEELLVALNASRETKAVDIKLEGSPPLALLQALFADAGGARPEIVDGWVRGLPLEPRSGNVWRIEPHPRP